MSFNINKFLFPDYDTDAGWLMNSGERAFFYYVLQNFNIDRSIEIGRYRGGSTIPMAMYSNKCYSIDPFPIEHPMYKDLPTLELIDDYSWNVLSTILSNEPDVNLILVDGDHETDSVKRELDLILEYIPSTYTIVLIHDTFYPQERAAMNSVDWSKYKHVHFVDLDFMCGTRWELGCMCHDDKSVNDISGMGRNGIYHLGFGLIIMLNEERDFDLPYYKSHQKVFDACMKKEPW